MTCPVIRSSSLGMKVNPQISKLGSRAVAPEGDAWAKRRGGSR
jgi:hypothetical protein